MIGETTQGRGNTRTHSYHGCGRGQNYQYLTDTHQQGGQGRGGHTHGSRGRGHHNRNTGNAGSCTYKLPVEWQAMTPDHCQDFLHAHAASRIHAITSSLTKSDEISTITRIASLHSSHSLHSPCKWQPLVVGLCIIADIRWWH